jgi:hypothetical protein
MAGDKGDARTGSRKGLVLALAVFVVAVAGVVIVGCMGYLPWYGLGPALTLESVLTMTGLAVMFVVLSSLPLLMIVGYRLTQRDSLMWKIADDLLLCGLEDTELAAKVSEFRDRNGLPAFVLPAVVNLALLVAMWGVTMMPTGLTGLSESLKGVELGQGYYGSDLGSLFEDMAQEASAVTWAFLGAYFYTVTALVRRWLESDLTTGIMWKANVRIAIALMVALLLIRVLPDASPLIAFVAGIVPDTVLRWLSQQVKRGAGFEEGRLFQPSDLQARADGMTFWQADRLSEEGIESVQDLAMTEIPDLLIRTRFDTPHLLYWVDCALLCNQAGALMDQFKKAAILTANDLLDVVGEKGHDWVLKSIQGVVTGGVSDPGESSTDAESAALTSRVTAETLVNIVVGLRSGPNLAYVSEYWRNTASPSQRRHVLTEARAE